MVLMGQRIVAIHDHLAHMDCGGATLGKVSIVGHALFGEEAILINGDRQMAGGGEYTVFEYRIAHLHGGKQMGI
jgi:hypothetical protein